jgi:quinol-cytochrome oxidoreductase complex cytochrome b subunit
MLGGLQKNVSAQKAKSSTPRRSVVSIKRAGEWRMLLRSMYLTGAYTIP